MNGNQVPTEVTALARRLGLSPDTIHYCLEVELVEQPLADPDLAELRRVRRLLDLEVNLAGVEIILRMRQQIRAMQIRLEAMATEMAAAQSQFENQIRELERRLARDLSL
jgi:DNA-binding transcriptional MerR regulator